MAVTGKLNAERESIALGVKTIPAPVRETPCGEPAALSAKLSVAVYALAAVGLKETETVQVAPAAKVVEQVVVCGKMDELLPVTETLVRVSATVPVFLRVTVCAAAVVPTATVPKARLAGVTLTVGTMPVPVSVTVLAV
jgi:hypothetical protein